MNKDDSQKKFPQASQTTDALPDFQLELVPCPLCGGSKWLQHRQLTDLLYKRPGQFRVVRCCTCGHLFVNPRPTPQTILDFYPPDYSPHQAEATPPGSLTAAKAEQTSSPPQASAHMKSSSPPSLLTRLLKAVPGAKQLFYWLLKNSDGVIIPPVSTNHAVPQALELGCGAGAFSAKLMELGWQVYAVEPVAQAAAKARAKGIHVFESELQEGLFSPKTFDAVFAWMVVEHLPDPVRVLKIVRGLLKTDGWLLFSVPNVACWEPYVFGRYWYSWQVPTHLHHFTPQTVRFLLKQSGFTCERIVFHANVLNWTGSLGLWLREKLPRSSLGPAFLAYNAHPRLSVQLATAPVAKFLAVVGQTGRMTVVARPQNSIL